MKKLILILVLVILCVNSYAQSIVNRSNSTITVSDSRLQAGLNLFTPRYADTTAANISKGIDSCGAIIFTYDINAHWYRECNPKKWVPLGGTCDTCYTQVDQAQDTCFTIQRVNGTVDTVCFTGVPFGNIPGTDVTILNDSTIIICNGVGNCDTLDITTNIYNLSTISFLNNSTIVVCGIDTLTLDLQCDTISIPQQQLYVFQNGVNSPASGIVEFGSNAAQPNTFFSHDTYLNTAYYKMDFYGFPTTGFPYGFRQGQLPNLGTGITSFKNSFYLPKLGIQYTNDTLATSPYYTGIFGNRDGFWVGQNFIAGVPVSAPNYNVSVDDPNGKIGGIFFNTLDTQNDEVFSLFGAAAAGTSTILRVDTTLMLTGYSNKKLRAWGYGQRRFEATPATISGWDANGNFVEVDTANIGGSVTFIDSTKIIICSFGNYLCDTIYTTTGSLFIGRNGITDSVDRYVLGGDLYKTTLISTNSYNLNISGDPAANGTVLSAVNNGGGHGFDAASSSGYGLTSQSTTGKSALFYIAPSSTNTTATVLEVLRATTATAANNIGLSIDLLNEANDGNNYISNQIISKLTTATAGSRVSQLIVSGVDNAVTADLFTLNGSGSTRLNKYGVGTFTGTPATYAAWDASGNLIELSSISQGPVITADNGLTKNTATNVQLGGTLIQNTTITGGSFGILVTGTGATNPLSSTTSSGIGLYGQTSTGIGVQGFASTTGLAGYFLANPSSTNTVVTVQRIQRSTSGSTANGIGAALDFDLETTVADGANSARIVSTLTDVTDATRTGDLQFFTTNSASPTKWMTIQGNGRVQLFGRFQPQQGADVASVAGAIAVGLDGNTFELTGTNAVTLISNLNWVNGSEITFVFTSTATLTDGTANSGTDIGMELNGNANFVGSAGDVLTLILVDLAGTQRWYEKSRSVN